MVLLDPLVRITTYMHHRENIDWQYISENTWLSEYLILHNPQTLMKLKMDLLDPRLDLNAINTLQGR